MCTGRPYTYEYLCALKQGAGVSFDRMFWPLPGHQSLMMNHKGMYEEECMKEDILFIKTW